MTPARAQVLASELVQTLSRLRVDLSSEKAAQNEVTRELRALGLGVEREVEIAERSRIDLLVYDIPKLGAPWPAVVCGVGVELKVKGARKVDAFKQLGRYAASPRVAAIVLASSQAMGLPAEIGGKPVFRASLTSGWM